MSHGRVKDRYILFKKSFGKGIKNAENVSFTQNDPNETFLSEFPTLWFVLYFEISVD